MKCIAKIMGFFFTTPNISPLSKGTVENFSFFFSFSKHVVCSLVYGYWINWSKDIDNAVGMFDDIDFIRFTSSNVAVDARFPVIFFLASLAIKSQCHGPTIVHVDNCYLWVGARRRMALYLIFHWRAYYTWPAWSAVVGREPHEILFSFHLHAHNCRERTNETVRHAAPSAPSCIRNLHKQMFAFGADARNRL